MTINFNLVHQMGRYFAFIFHVTVAYLFVYSRATGGTELEYGGILKQQLTLTQPADYDVVSVVKFAALYAEKRFPWSLPPRISGKTRKHPQVVNLSKVNLVYSYDEKMPLHFDSEITDRYGRRHGFTSMIIFGSMYRFQLGWKDKTLRFFHNFTVSVYPHDYKTIYSHTFFIATENITETSRTPGYLTKDLKNVYLLQLPFNTLSQDSSYTSWSNLNQVDSFKFASDHVTERLSQSEEKQCGVNGYECDEPSYKDAEIKYTLFKNKKFSIMSYNIWNMNPEAGQKDDYVKRMKRLKQVIADADADILGIQEVRYEESKGGVLGPSQIQTLADWFPEYQYVFQPAQMQPNSLHDGRTEEGVAILSKFPIVSQHHKFLFRNRSNSADTHQRVLLHTEIMFPLLGKMHILNTHLSLSHEAREQSVIQIWQYVKQLHGPVVFLGDLNAEPQETAVQYLNGKDVLTSERSEFKDVWLERHGLESKGFTYNPREELSKRIDYMYLRPGDTCCQIESCDILDDGKRGVEAASDHLPLKAVFSFQAKKEPR